MFYEIDMLKALPKIKRNIADRKSAKDADPQVREISLQYGQEYFDGDRKYGYGGYRYDGRWVPIAKNIIEHFKLKPGDRVLDIGCAKGFLVKDLREACPGLEVVGIDISEYAIEHAHPDAKDFVSVGNANHLPYPDGHFNAAISINTIHNFDRDGVVQAMREIQRVSNGNAFVQVDSYLSPEQKELFENWVLTARFHDYPEGWFELFKEAGYTGGYYWTLV